jgi:prophage tail gpP-like protein
MEFFRSLGSAAGEFNFKASNTAADVFPLSKGDECEIWIDDNKVMTGFTNSIGGYSDPETTEIRLRGRDKVQDLVDSYIKSDIDFKTSVDILTMFKRVLGSLGITGINVKMQQGLTVRRFSKSELASAKIGDNAFEFLQKFCRMRQLLITSNSDGDVILTRAGSGKYTTILKKEIGGTENNILRSDFEDNDASRFREYIVISQGNPIDQLFNDSTVSKKSLAQDLNIRAGRIMVINSDISSDLQTNSDRAKWESNIRRVKGFQYNCRIRGFYLDAKSTVLIEPNNLIQVIDERFGIDAELLIKSCRYIKSLDGTFTDISLVNKDAFTLEEQQKGIESKFNKKDDIFSQLGL